MAIFTGTPADEVLIGTEADDLLRGRGGADQLNGRGGIDIVSYTDSPRMIIVDLASGTGRGGDAAGDTFSGIETVHGSSFDDQISGGTSDDVLRGQSGGDLLRGRAGADILDGGAGRDTATYSDSMAAVTVDLAAGTGTGGDAQGDVLLSIEILHGSGYNDILRAGKDDHTLRGLSGDDLLIAGEGADIIEGGSGVDTASYEADTEGVIVDLAAEVAAYGYAAGDRLTGIENLTGGSGNDRFAGNDAANQLQGGGGNDRLSGGGGSDLLDGGSGTDVADYGTAANGIIGGRDAISDRVNGDVDYLTSFEAVFGSTYADIIWNNGFSASNRVLAYIAGGAGDDILMNGASQGTDTIDGNATTFDGGAGSDWIQYFSPGGALTIDLSTGRGSGDIAEGDRYISIENVLIAPRLQNTPDAVTPRLTHDHITGTGGANYIDGGGGQDEIHSGGGDDYIIGRIGAGLFDGGTGFDTIDYSYETGGAATIDLMNGTGGTGISAGSIYVSIEAAVGTAFDDSLTGTSGDDQLTGGAGADLIDGGDGESDTAVYVGRAVRIDLSTGTGSWNEAEGDILSGIENVIAGATMDMLIGDAGANLLDGRAGNDLLSGRDGDDILIGGAGADQLHGGAGSDTASYAASTGAISVDLAVGTGLGGHAAGDTLEQIERLIGTAYADQLLGDATGNILNGGDGADLLSGRSGNDILIGGTGGDRLYGGTGRDLIIYAESAEAVSIDLSTGMVSGGDAEGDILHDVEGVSGSAFEDLLIGSTGEDTLLGAGGDDLISGGEGADYVDGGDGFDRMSYADDIEGIVIDLSTGLGAGGTATNDFLISIEAIDGGAGNDVIRGDTGDTVEHLSGGAGDDVIEGRGAADVLSGGSGADRFVYSSVSDSTAEDGDVILDHRRMQGDVIDLSGIDADTGTAGNQSFSFIGDAAFSNHAGELRTELDGSSMRVLADVDGDGSADMEIILAGITTPRVVADFLL